MVTCIIKMAGIEIDSKPVPSGLSAEVMFITMIQHGILPLPKMKGRGPKRACDLIGIEVNGVPVVPHRSCEMCGEQVLRDGDVVVYDYAPNGDPEKARLAIDLARGLRELIDEVGEMLAKDVRMSAKARWN